MGRGLAIKKEWQETCPKESKAGKVSIEFAFGFRPISLACTETVQPINRFGFAAQRGRRRYRREGRRPGAVRFHGNLWFSSFHGNFIAY